MPINWELLLHGLETGKCILCTGPDLYSRDHGARLEKRLADTLRRDSAKLGIRVYDDGWFHYLKDPDELSTWFSIKQFYETQLPTEANAVIADIVTLPFPLILHFSPDTRLCSAFEHTGRPFIFDYLQKTPEVQFNKIPEKPDDNKTLIFNMLGEIKDKDSLVMTYDDLFGYMEAILEKKRLPQPVKLKIQQATHFVFLGMPLDKWYFHLFMRVLNLHRDTSKTKRMAASYTVDAENAMFCEEQYTLTFVQENIADFVKKLKSEWQAAQAKKTGIQSETVFDRWRQLVKTGEDVSIRTVFREIKPYTEGNGDFINSALLLEMQWNGFVSTNFETEMAKTAMKTRILDGLLGLIDQLEQHKPQDRP